MAFFLTIDGAALMIGFCTGAAAGVNRTGADSGLPNGELTDEAGAATGFFTVGRTGVIAGGIPDILIGAVGDVAITGDFIGMVAGDTTGAAFGAIMGAPDGVTGDELLLETPAGATDTGARVVEVVGGRKDCFTGVFAWAAGSSVVAGMGDAIGEAVDVFVTEGTEAGIILFIGANVIETTGTLLGDVIVTIVGEFV